MRKMDLSIRDLCLVGIFTAIIAVISQLSIPMPYGVPMTMQTFAIALAGMVLGTKKGTLSALVYVLLGALGAPVFSGFSGGMGVVLGMAGGFVLSFPLLALAVGIGESKNNTRWLTAGLVVGIVVNYACGMLWFSFVMSSDWKTAFTACVLPFIPTDAIKAFLVVVFGRRMKGALVKGGILPQH